MRIFVFFLLTIVSCSPLIKYEDTAAKWENEIVKLEKLDSSQDYTKNQILFIGSSSIRLWKSIKKDLKPYQVIKSSTTWAISSKIPLLNGISFPIMNF